MHLLFDLIFLVYMICYLPVLFLRGKWHDGMMTRLGFIPAGVRKQLTGRRNIWLHAVSVGEVAAIDGLIRQLRTKLPDRQIVLSVTTQTGYSLAQRNYQGLAVVIWSPLDLSPVVRDFVSAIRPEIYIAAETELWPNLFTRLAEEKVKILIVNGRISDEAFPRYRLVSLLLRTVLSKVSAFCVQSELDAKKMIRLGAPAERVQNVGNIKFDIIPAVPATSVQDLGLEQGRMVWVAGSTHAGEEDIVVDIYKSLRAGFPELRLVIAPRHPERAPGIVQSIRNNGLEPVLFSSSRRTTIGPEQVMVVDTIGQLLRFYSAAAVVFVGKSLTVKGGHNIIEPAVLGKPILIGPYMHNFMEITRVFLNGQAVIQVRDAAGLKQEVSRLLSSTEERVKLGERARAVVQQNQGAMERTIAIILSTCGMKS